MQESGEWKGIMLPNPSASGAGVVGAKEGTTSRRRGEGEEETKSKRD